MKNYSNKKNKIVLSDYNYRKDIHQRVVLSNLSSYDLEVLQEIVDGSLQISIPHLAETLNGDHQKLYLSLDKLKTTKLFNIEKDVIYVDKEMRKYYESQINKFSPNFQPGMDFLQSLLTKVPLHVLPSWYPICRSSDHLFSTIVEKYLGTTKLYERYLNELDFDNPILKGIQSDLFKAEDFKIPSQVIIEKYHLKREEFEECLLHLEFNFVCCISYEKKGSQWEEMITPFYEWHEYLRYKRDHFPKAIKQNDKIVAKNGEEFASIKKFNQSLRQLQATHQVIEDAHFAKRAKQLNLLNAHTLQPTEELEGWLRLSEEDQAYIFYNLFDKRDHRYDERDMREVEKSFKHFAHMGWIYYSDMLKGFNANFGEAEPFVLKNRGKKWKYTLPEYSTEEKDFIHQMICVRLHDAGMINLGHHEDQLCLSVTPFGLDTLSI